MHIHTYGSPSAPVLILLHPLGLSGQQFYEFLRPYLKSDYYVIAPDQGGHGDDPGDYISPANDGKTLLRYLKEQGLLQIRLLFGASIGAAAALRLLEDPELQCGHVHLDSIPLLSRSGAKQSIVSSVILKEMKKHRNNPATMDEERAEFERNYGKELTDILFGKFLTYSEKSLKNLCAAFFSNSGIRDLPVELHEKITVEWGANDKICRQSERNIKRNFPHAQLLVREGESHCSYLAKYAEEYIREMEDV